jgi:signal transduction histidine kinase
LKLTAKLILAFLLVILFSIGLIALVTRTATNHEFEKFVNNQYKAELVEQLTRYYKLHKTWDGVEKQFTRDNHEPFGGEVPPPLFFSIADKNGFLIIAGHDYSGVKSVDAEELAKGSRIIVNNEIVGVLLIATDPDRNPMAQEFLRRMNGLIFLSAVGAIIIALFLGVIISRNITRPILELTKATHEMANGNLSQQVPIRSHDEIGELAQSFNKMSDDLSRSFNLRKQMTADIAHELRTPLSLIIGHAEGVHDGVLQPSLENFEIIREEAERLEKLVNDLRTLSLADAGELSVDFQPVDINAFLGDIHSHYVSIFNQKRISLDLEPAPVILKANLDLNRFAQVLNNILDNALRYTPEDGKVTIKALGIGNKIQISIHDSGEGVSPEEAQRLFDRFYRVDESRARYDGGSGLGLAIARSIVEMHKGRVWAESEIGRGLKIVIELPKLSA